MNRFFLIIGSILLSHISYCQTADEYFKIGNIKLNSEDYSDAIVEFNKAIEINPEFEQAYFGRGFAKIELKDFNGALDDFNTAVEINPNDETSYYMRGLARAELNDLKGAINDFSIVIKINPKFPEVYYYRGYAKIELGETQSGCLDLRKARLLGYDDAKVAIEEFCNDNNNQGNLYDYNYAIAVATTILLILGVLVIKEKKVSKYWYFLLFIFFTPLFWIIVGLIKSNNPTIKTKIISIASLLFGVTVFLFYTPSNVTVVDETKTPRISQLNSSDTEISTYNMLIEVEKEINKIAPFMIDEETRLDSSIALPNNELQYYYTFINVDIDLFDIDVFEELILSEDEHGMKYWAINEMKTNPAVKIFKGNNVTLTYKYKDMNGYYITEFSITPEDYNN